MTMYDTIYLTNEDSPMFTQMRCDTMSKPGEMSNGYYPGTHCLIKPKVIKDRFHVNHLIPSSTPFIDSLDPLTVGIVCFTIEIYSD